VVVSLPDFAQQMLTEARCWVDLADKAARALAGPDCCLYPEEKKAVVLDNLAPQGLSESVTALELVLRSSEIQ
jgi:hypothetical protein